MELATTLGGEICGSVRFKEEFKLEETTEAGCYFRKRFPPAHPVNRFSSCGHSNPELVKLFSM
jgi:hypothetical protein